MRVGRVRRSNLWEDCLRNRNTKLNKILRVNKLHIIYNNCIQVVIQVRFARNERVAICCDALKHTVLVLKRTFCDFRNPLTELWLHSVKYWRVKNARGVKMQTTQLCTTQILSLIHSYYTFLFRFCLLLRSLIASDDGWLLHSHSTVSILVCVQVELPTWEPRVQREWETENPFRELGTSFVFLWFRYNANCKQFNRFVCEFFFTLLNSPRLRRWNRWPQCFRTCYSKRNSWRTYSPPWTHQPVSQLGTRSLYSSSTTKASCSELIKRGALPLYLSVRNFSSLQKRKSFFEKMRGSLGEECRKIMTF